MTIVETPFAWPMGQGDTLPALTGTLIGSNGVAVDLTYAISVVFNMASRDGRKVVTDGTVTVLDAMAGRVEYAWQAGDTDIAGDFTYSFTATFPSGTLTFTNAAPKGIVRISPRVP